MFELNSKVHAQGASLKSLKTTIPAEIVKALHLQRNDTIRWIVSAENDQLVIKVEKKIDDQE